MSVYDKVSLTALPQYGIPGLMPSWQDPNVKSEISCGSTAQYPSRGLSHRMVPIEGNKLRACALCSLNKIKTRSGWGVYTRHKCEACTVPLCKGKRDCFQAFHRVFGYKYDVTGQTQKVQDISKLSRIEPMSHTSSSAMPSTSTAEQDRQDHVQLYKSSSSQYSNEYRSPGTDQYGHDSGNVAMQVSRIDEYEQDTNVTKSLDTEV
ncbi:hypothetical protein KP79_PYT18778 [Mizuhopecten yessoensis]|uniref:PiggyBac transposable element-derived protein 4 C-terminal zinc-finger domain-containing protein n=2 Tax=Mizuhopecten yessoensis TaxID=6573 RepID=A0A210Q3I9_MIZYE|nr:hypothetical protein KP79_PYT18778 [Mizuhopecten yessoensis]